MSTSARRGLRTTVAAGLAGLGTRLRQIDTRTFSDGIAQAAHAHHVLADHPSHG